MGVSGWHIRGRIEDRYGLARGGHGMDAMMRLSVQISHDCLLNGTGHGSPPPSLTALRILDTRTCTAAALKRLKRRAFRPRTPKRSAPAIPSAPACFLADRT